MTHIIEVSDEELMKLQNGKPFSLIKQKRDILVGDTVIFEHNVEQYQCDVKDAQTAPGLMKGYVLLAL